MRSGKRLLRWASGIMLVLGAGHLSLSVLIAWDGVTGWVDRGLWAAVPLVLTGGGAGKTVESLRNDLAFWAGTGSFSVPLILLGCLTWHLAGRGVAVPAGIGWGLAAWCALSGVLLVPSPFFAGTVAGALIVMAARIMAARKGDQPGGRSPGSGTGTLSPVGVELVSPPDRPTPLRTLVRRRIGRFITHDRSPVVRWPGRCSQAADPN